MSGDRRRYRSRLDPGVAPEVRWTTTEGGDRGGTVAVSLVHQETAKSGEKRCRGVSEGGEESRGEEFFHRAGAVRENDGQRIDRPRAEMMVQGCPISPILLG